MAPDQPRPSPPEDPIKVAVPNQDREMRMFSVLGRPTYVESGGSGAELLYLHGAAEWAGYSDALVSLLEQGYRVVQPERRGHGRTPDSRGSLHYAEMAQDTIALIEGMRLDAPHVVGFSDGAIVALEVACMRPELVSKVVAIGPNVSVSGLTEEALEWLADVTPDTWPEEPARMHRSLSPDGPGHWPVFAQKVIDMLRREPEIPLAELAAIRAPTLVVGADRDLIRLEHLVEIFRAIPGAQLCIIPGASHELTVEVPGLLAQVVARFLAAG
jgi:pimeloyl-ACP methyl ester carboxylesterase